MIRTLFLIAAILIILTSCRQADQGSAAVILPTPASNPVATITNTATMTPTPAQSASPTPTATIRPTPPPTATAVPVTLSGDPRSAILSAPVPNGSAPCGVVDLFDFPLDPPHARSARGGGDFGVWRNRFDKFHAGEDWGMATGNNLGQPVYSIGHGLVTYAEPEGWGRDKGVVIIRHTFADGHNVLSFYGHLDPPSVTLSPGLCVTRGEQIGQIGQPRSRPHLHFEIRTHLPYQTSTGYWPEDPRLEGWLPPSQTIWDSRLSASPGVQWTKAFADDPIQNIGLTNDGIFVASAGNQVLGIDTTNGEAIWTFNLSEMSDALLLDAGKQILYSVGQLGQVEAYRLPANLEVEAGAAGSNALNLAWSLDLDLVGIPQLLPLPGGGLVIFFWDQLAAISPTGDLLWGPFAAGRPYSSAQIDDALLVSSLENGSSLHTITAENFSPWSSSPGGLLASNTDNLLLYNEEGLFRLDPPNFTAEKLLDLPGRQIELSALLLLSNSHILISHLDQGDRRLILLDSQGKIIWQRSIARLGFGATALIEIDGQAYLLVQDGEGEIQEVMLYAVDEASGDLTLLFNGGSRSAASAYTGIQLLSGSQILLNIGGRSLTSLTLPP